VSAPRAIHCTGAPRDLGLDQGEALGAHVRGSLRASARGAALLAQLREWLPGSRAARAWRDVQCYFPHHAERMLGLSVGARVPTRALVAKLADLVAGDGGLCAAVSAARAGQALLARSFGPGLDAGALAVRHSAPDNDYRTVELAAVWSVAAAIGVNQHGLAATATALPAEDPLLRGCAAPAALLVQDVLQRFDTVEKAVEWAMRRPAGGRASLLLADASGRVAGVGIEGRKRTAIAEGGDVLIGFGATAARAALEKGLAEARTLDAAALARVLGEPCAQPRLVAVADPAGRRLGVARADAALEWSEVGAA
jgi:hypothetical protein